MTPTSNASFVVSGEPSAIRRQYRDKRAAKTDRLDDNYIYRKVNLRVGLGAGGEIKACNYWIDHIRQSIREEEIKT